MGKNYTKPTKEVDFNDDYASIKNPFELTKKQIWFKAFQRCFDKGSEEMAIVVDDIGRKTNNIDVFLNSVLMFQLMATETLNKDDYKDLKEKIDEIDKLLLINKKDVNDQLRQLNEKVKHDKNINYSESQMSILMNSKKFEIEQNRYKLGWLAIMMERENYLDSTFGIID